MSAIGIRIHEATQQTPVAMTLFSSLDLHCRWLRMGCLPSNLLWAKQTSTSPSPNRDSCRFVRGPLQDMTGSFKTNRRNVQIEFTSLMNFANSVAQSNPD